MGFPFYFLHTRDVLKFTVLLKPVLKIVTWQTDTTPLLYVLCRWQVTGCSYWALLYSDPLRTTWMSSWVAVCHLSFMHILWICSKMFSADNWVRCSDSAGIQQRWQHGEDVSEWLWGLCCSSLLAVVNVISSCVYIKIQNICTSWLVEIPVAVETAEMQAEFFV